MFIKIHLKSNNFLILNLCLIKNIFIINFPLSISLSKKSPFLINLSISYKPYIPESKEYSFPKFSQNKNPIF